MQLNAVVFAMQKIKVRMTFPAIECAGRLCAHSDSSFKRKEERGCGMRRAVYMRLDKCRTTGKKVCHLLDGSEPIAPTCASIFIWPGAARRARSS
eukprot:9491622-Pyramimonas_sp.AAC.1